MTPVLALAALASLTGCTKPDTTVQPLGGWIQASDAVGVDVSSSTGPAPHVGLARAVNEFGASVGSGPMDVDIDGSATSISFDAWGYGDIDVANPHSADVWSGDQQAWVTATDGDFQGFATMPAAASFGDVVAIEAASNGSIVATPHEVYWVPYSGTPHRLLNFPEREVRGLRAAHLDADGVLDGVAWAGDTVAFLRGRPDGGMSWAGGVQLEGMNAGGVVAKDVTGDDNIDITIAWGSDTDNSLQIWEGNGLFEFDDWPAVSILEPPTGLAVGDNNADGTQQFTVMLERSVNWQRFLVAGGQVQSTGPNLATLGMEPGADVLSGADLNGDGGDELFLFAPLVPGANRIVRIYDLVGQNIQFVPLDDYAEAQLTVADGDVDGLIDLFALTNEVSGDRDLIHLRWNGSQYTQRRSANLSDHGPISFNNVTDDDVLDMLLGGQTWTWWPGALNETESGIWWSVDDPVWSSWTETGLDMGPIAQGDTDNDSATVEWVGIIVEGGESVLKTWTINEAVPPAAPSQQQLRSTVLSSQAIDGLDVAVCGTWAYALNEAHLSRVNLMTGIRARRIDTTATRVACGDGPSGSVASILDGNTVRHLDSQLAEVGTEDGSGAVDLAIADGSVVMCSDDDCEIAAYSYGDGWATATATPDGLTIEHDDTVRDMNGPGGSLSVWDVDSDGTDDLIAVGAGNVVVVYLSSGDGVGVGNFSHSQVALAGGVVVGDVTSDGQPELIGGDGLGEMFLSRGLNYVAE